MLFTATTNGNYALEILHNGCIDTSACYPITSVGIHESVSNNNITISPNPTTGRVQIDLGSFQKDIEVPFQQVVADFENEQFLNGNQDWSTDDWIKRNINNFYQNFKLELYDHMNINISIRII